MTDLWLGALLLVSLVAVLWPFLFYPLVLRALPTQPERPIAGPTPSASLLFCAYNEAAAMPDKLANRHIDRNGLTQMASGGRKWLGWIEHIVRPRLTVITGKRSERVIGLFLCIFCASILVPLPMTNTVPGFAVAIASFGLMQKDGLMVIGGLIIGTAWVSGLIGAVMLGAVSLFG